MSLWTAHYVVSREVAPRQVSSRRSASVSITRSQALSVRKSPKRPESVNITKSIPLAQNVKGFVFNS